MATAARIASKLRAGSEIDVLSDNFIPHPYQRICFHNRIQMS